MPVKVNVIPLNEDPVYLPGWKRPDEAAISRFVERLVAAHVTATVRAEPRPRRQRRVRAAEGANGGPARRKDL